MDKPLNKAFTSGEEVAPDKAIQAAGDGASADGRPAEEAAAVEEGVSAEAEAAEPADDDGPDDLDVAPLPEVTKGIDDEETEAKEVDMPASSPRSFGCGTGKMPRGKLRGYDWLRAIPDGARLDVVQVQFKNTRSGFYRNDQHLPLKAGDMVAVEASPGHDIGEVVMTGPLVRLQMRRCPKERDEMKRVFRIARPADMEKYEEAIAREHDTMIRSRKIAEELGLDVKIGDVEYQGDGAKAIFYYIADERVDFRKLIRILADTFKIRVEMKQIGARQEAGRIGGIGPCGRPFCCSSWLSNFVSVSTSAARFQDISMNPQKLAGQCGKLKCCLNFEVDDYMEASRKLPGKDVVLLTADGEYHLFKSDILKGEITYSTDKSVPANLETITAARAFEIIALNKQGVKPETLAVKTKTEPTPESTGFINMVGQDSLTRFDKSKRRKKKKSGAARQAVAEKSPAANNGAPEAGAAPTPKQGKGQTPKQDNGKPKGEGRKPKAPQEQRKAPQESRKPAQEQRKAAQEQRNKPPQEQRKPQREPRKPRPPKEKPADKQ